LHFHHSELLIARPAVNRVSAVEGIALRRNQTIEADELLARPYVN
jgi:hypothetical protein